MVTKEQIYMTVDKFINNKLDVVLGDNPFIRLMKPTVHKMVSNSIDRYTTDINKVLTLLENKDGKIDVEGLMNDTISEFETMPVTTMKHDLLGDVQVGEGKVVLEMFVPVINTTRRIVITKDDFLEFVQLLNKISNV